MDVVLLVLVYAPLNVVEIALAAVVELAVDVVALAVDAAAVVVAVAALAREPVREVVLVVVVVVIGEGHARE